MVRDQAVVVQAVVDLVVVDQEVVDQAVVALDQWARDLEVQEVLAPVHLLPLRVRNQDRPLQRADPIPAVPRRRNLLLGNKFARRVWFWWLGLRSVVLFWGCESEEIFGW